MALTISYLRSILRLSDDGLSDEGFIPTPALPVILAPRNCDSNINDICPEKSLGDEAFYLCADTVQLDDVSGRAGMIFPSEYINTLRLSKFPLAELKVKAGVPLILLRSTSSLIWKSWSMELLW
jgi:hypothetical protein